MNKFAKIVLKEMHKKALNTNVDKVVDILESKYNDILFSAWDNEEVSLEDTIKELLVKENIKLSNEDIKDIEDYFNVYFM